MLVIEMATQPERDDLIMRELVEELKRKQNTIARYTSSYNEVVEPDELNALLEASDQVETAMTMANDVMGP